MPQLIDAIGRAFSDWPKETLISAMFAIKGHMDRLEELGEVRLLADRRPSGGLQHDPLPATSNANFWDLWTTDTCGDALWSRLLKRF